MEIDYRLRGQAAASAKVQAEGDAQGVARSGPVPVHHPRPVGLAGVAPDPGPVPEEHQAEVPDRQPQLAAQVETDPAATESAGEFRMTLLSRPRYRTRPLSSIASNLLT